MGTTSCTAKCQVICQQVKFGRLTEKVAKVTMLIMLIVIKKYSLTRLNHFNSSPSGKAAVELNRLAF
jgi:hypothetical protein